VILLARQVGGVSSAPLAEQLRIVSPASRLVVIAEAVAEGAELARLAKTRIHCHILCGELTPEEFRSSLRLISDRDMRMVSGPVLDAFVESYERLRSLEGGVRLPRRECDVVALLAEGLTRKAIGSRLTMARTTVSTHISRAKDRLGAVTDADLIAAARRHGLLPSDGARRH
jgi:DNA-binding NarL/FixJ family response regulator